MNIRKLIIEDVRCFAGRQEFDIRPLTFLVGENSTGKSTILGCFDTLFCFLGARDFISRIGFARRGNLDFNVPPYQMGVFADIVRISAPEKESFKLGYEFQSENRKENIEYILTLGEKEEGSEPVVREQKLFSRDSEIILLGEHKKDMKKRMMIDASETDGKKKFRINISDYLATTNIFEFLHSVSRHSMPLLGPVSHLPMEGVEVLSPDEKKLQQSADDILQALSARYMGEIDSSAPIRSKPRRTYDPLSEVISSEGADVPTMLRNMSRKDPEEWQRLREQLVAFGQSSGLFTDIIVRKLGTSMGDPFQLHVKVRKQKSNLIDTGYGISQLLPILVRLFNARHHVRFLMQQPEVHLHPKAQAELSSLLANLMKHQHHHFIVETHSDAMIDRVRIEIMKKKISPEDVSLIYLEPKGNSIDVHNIKFDEQANLVGAPSGYRDFFLKESDRLLGFTED